MERRGWLAGRRPLGRAVAMAGVLATEAAVSLAATVGHGSVWSQVAALTLMAPFGTLSISQGMSSVTAWAESENVRN